MKNENLDSSNISINYIDASRLTPQQIKDLETLGKKYPGHVIQADSLDTLLIKESYGKRDSTI